MPRKEIELEYSIEYLSVLDENGALDKDLRPNLTEEQLLQFHRAMLLARRFDERLLLLQREGHIGTFAPVTGQEAAQIGAVAGLKNEDWMIPAFREIAAILWRGSPPSALIIFNAGYNEGGKIPDQQQDFPNAVPVASQLPHAVGIAYGIRYRKKKEVVLTFFGDGATSEGDFHEALNFAAVFRVPAVFVCQNNHWAISVPREKQTKSKTLAQKALAYGVPGIQVDGNDVLAVYAATQEAIERARSGGGPTLIECVTYRLAMHTTVDDPSKYRKEEEVKAWEKRDPLPRFQKFIMDEGHLSEQELDALEGEIKEQLDAQWEEAKQQMEKMGDPMDMFNYVYAQLPPYLQEQKAAFSEFLGSQKGKSHA